MTFENPKVQPHPRQVQVSQVTTETEFLQRSTELQATLQSGTFTNYCNSKIMSAPSDAEQDIWRFLMVNERKRHSSGNAWPVQRWEMFLFCHVLTGEF